SRGCSLDLDDRSLDKIHRPRSNSTRVLIPRKPHTTDRWIRADVALLRAAAAPLTNVPDQWPDLSDTGACRVWLDRMWSRRHGDRRPRFAGVTTIGL
ncbi:MAG: hypothetical protein ACRDTC_11215, partial [Pseudonocardiaceae bacterium]